jgi:hypothetical protein
MASIPVNRKQWESLSNDQQQEIVQGLKEVGALSDDDEIIGSDDVPEQIIPDSDLIREAASVSASCEAACNAAYAAAVARCNFLPHPAARAVCFSAAMAAYAICLRNC